MIKSCTVRRRFYTAEAAGAAITVDLEPGFGTPKACLIMYTESSANTNAFDTTLAVRNLGIGIVGPADSTVSSSLVYRSVTSVMSDNASPSSVRRANSNTRYMTASDLAGAVFWQFTSASFSADRATFTPPASTPQTNGHLDTIMTFFTGTGLSVGIGDTSFATTAAGTRDFSGLAWIPDVVIVASTITALNASLTDDFRFCFGCATRSPLKQKGIYMHQENSATPANVDIGTLSSSNTIVTYSTSNAVGPYTHTISNIVRGGWTMTSSDAAGGANNNYIYLAMSTETPTDFALVDILSNTSTGVQFTGLGSSGFVPKTILGAVTNCPTDNTRETTSPNADAISLFSGNRGNDELYFNGTGTIQTNSAGTAVTGVGTEFFRLAPGDKIYQTNNTLIGTVSGVTSKTAMTLTGNAAATLPAGTAFVYSNPGQYSLFYGNTDNSNPSYVFSGIAGTLIAISNGQASSANFGDLAILSDFDTRNGYELNHTKVTGTARRGWALAVKSDERAKRHEDPYS